jgi:tetratricopeptide (TPR) repeat protein
MEAGKLEEALAAYEPLAQEYEKAAAEQNKPVDRMMAYQSGIEMRVSQMDILIRLKRYDQALAICEMARKTVAGSGLPEGGRDQLLGRVEGYPAAVARKLTEDGRYEEAEKMIREATANRPDLRDFDDLHLIRDIGWGHTSFQPREAEARRWVAWDAAEYWLRKMKK